LVEKWFGAIPTGPTVERQIPAEPPQKVLQKRVNVTKVPVDALYLAFHTCSRMDKDYYAVDLLSDVLSNGPSSRLYRRLLKNQELFSHIDGYITGSIDPGLFIIEGKPSENVPLETAEAAIWRELEEVKNALIAEKELEKIKNKAEASLVFSEASVLNKAINLAYFEMLGDPGLINRETGCYQAVSIEDIQRVAREIFSEENCSKLYYKTAEDAS